MSSVHISASEEPEPALSQEGEALLWEQLRRGDEDAREKLILAHRPIVFWMVKKLSVNFQLQQDLVQEGMLSLIKAVDKFDSARGNKFITYAYYKVRGQMVNFLQRVEARAPFPVEPDSITGGSDFETDIDKMELAFALDKSFETLEAREAEIVKSLLIEGTRASEVADRMGVGVSHIYRLQRGALRKLKCWFQQSDATENA